MRGRTSETGKQLQGRGKGTGAKYKPWNKIREYSSTGTAVSFPDWKHGRMIELLSQGELWFYLILRWNDDIIDIREQYPLEKEDTDKIAEHLGFRAFNNGKTRMTTNLLVTWKDGHMTAYAVESDRAHTKNKKRKIECLLIEYHYWLSRNVRWKILFKEDLDPIFIRNIRDVVSCYKEDRVFDEIGLIRHLIAHKLINVDMYQPLDYKSIILKNKGTETWKNYHYILEQKLQTGKELLGESSPSIM